MYENVGVGLLPIDVFYCRIQNTVLHTVNGPLGQLYRITESRFGYLHKRECSYCRAEIIATIRKSHGCTYVCKNCEQQLLDSRALHGSAEQYSVCELEKDVEIITSTRPADGPQNSKLWRRNNDVTMVYKNSVVRALRGRYMGAPGIALGRTTPLAITSVVKTWEDAESEAEYMFDSLVIRV